MPVHVINLHLPHGSQKIVEDHAEGGTLHDAVGGMLTVPQAARQPEGALELLVYGSQDSQCAAIHAQLLVLRDYVKTLDIR